MLLFLLWCLLSFSSTKRLPSMIGSVSDEVMFESTSHQLQESSHSRDSLPADPRSWTREQVSMWLHRAANQFELSNTFPERFPMNGKALLLMTKEMFLYRVPEGGGLLYEDIQLKLQKVMMESFERRTALNMLGTSSTS